MEDIVNIIEINKYMYFDKNCGVFCLTSEASEIIYRQKKIICSYSGADEWINFFTLEMMHLKTCNVNKEIPKDLTGYSIIYTVGDFCIGRRIW